MSPRAGLLAFLRGGRGWIEDCDMNKDRLSDRIRRVDALGLPEGGEEPKKPLRLEDLGDLKARARAG